MGDHNTLEDAQHESANTGNPLDIPALTTPDNEPVEAKAPTPTQGQLSPLTSKELEERLDKDQSTISRNKNKGFEPFRKWTAEHDPDEIAWEYRPGKKGTPQYYPILKS